VQGRKNDAEGNVRKWQTVGEPGKREQFGPHSLLVGLCFFLNGRQFHFGEFNIRQILQHIGLIEEPQLRQLNSIKFGVAVVEEGGESLKTGIQSGVLLE
jgi:hypothetical protein